MSKVKLIICAFCNGTGRHPHFGGTCPVCKGTGKNQVTGKYMTCRDCRGSGQKGGTALTCWTCGGLGVVPDTREVLRKAKREIKKAREEMAKEREEFRERPLAKRNMEIETLKAENKRLRKKLNKIESKKRPALPPRDTDVTSGEELAAPAGGRAIKSAIASYCSDCALGEERKCWHIGCSLAPYSPIAAAISQ